MTELPPLPEGDEPPSVDALAERLASLLPADEHEDARTVLAERVLPRALAGMAEHPRPRRYAEVVYEEIGERLAGVAPEARSAEVERVAEETDIRSLGARAQSLAVARYLSDDPNAVGRAGAFLDADAEAWRQRPGDEIAAEAERLQGELEEWADHAREDHPELFETRRTDYLHAKLALGSARTGAFGTTAGPLYDFLAKMGTARDRLDIS
jgi:hypothetical protein